MLKKSCREFFSPRVGAQQSPLCNPRVNYGSNGNNGTEKGRLRSSSWKVKSAKESPHSISCKELGAILEHPATMRAINLTVVPQSRGRLMPE